MNDLGNFLDYSLWSRDFKYDEVASLLKLLHENFEKDIELMRNKIKDLKLKNQERLALVSKIEIRRFWISL